jgi:ataxin-3
VHALNNLLQGPLLNEVALAEVAHSLDAQERIALQGSGLELESGNVRADGFFSVQVITLALQQLGLQSTPIGAESMRGVAAAPERESAFIFNRSEHWFAVRKLGGTFFDLNSTQPTPRVLSTAQLDETVREAQRLGYSTFVVRGALPPARIEAQPDRLRRAIAACTEASASGGSIINRGAGGGGGGGGAAPGFDAFSGQGQTLSTKPAAAAAVVSPEVEALRSTDPELAAALIASMADSGTAAPKRSAEDEAAEVRRKRLERFGGS